VTIRKLLRIAACIPAFLLLFGCAAQYPVLAQCSEVATDEGYRVRDVKVETFLGGVPPELKKALAKHRGEKYSADDENGHQITRDVVRNEVLGFFVDDATAGTRARETSVNEDRRAGFNQQNAFYVRAKFATDCIKKVPVDECRILKDDHGAPVDKCLDITVKIKVVTIDTSSLSANLLELARSNRLRFYRELPSVLRKLDPSFWVDYDRDFGSTAVLNSNADLLEILAPQKERNPARNTQLHLLIDGRKSLQNRFYDTTTTLALSRTDPLKPLAPAAFNATFSTSEQPEGDGLRINNSLRIGGAKFFNLANGPFTKLGLSANFRRAHNRFYNQAGLLSERSLEHAFESRALVEGKIARGFTRGAVWFDGASQTAPAVGSYQRLAMLAGYARDFVLPSTQCKVVELQDGSKTCEFSTKNAPTLGVEMLFGAGHAWGTVPEYARFYGGNSRGNFLYDAVNESAPVDMPSGPLIRSFGRNRAGSRDNLNRVQGGTSYWHYNLSLTVGIKKLSRPLIPAEAIVSGPSPELECSDCTSLKQALKNQVAGEKNIFIDAMTVRAMTPEQREDLAIDPDDTENPPTPEQLARLAAAEKVFEEKRKAAVIEGDRVWNRLTPTIEYIADHANLYAIKPLMMFDAARIASDEGLDQRVRLGLGGGIQFNLVVAKFELGYVRGVRRLPGDQKGNFVIRLLFEKLF
jgi:hypothetical protein